MLGKTMTDTAGNHLQDTCYFTAAVRTAAAVVYHRYADSTAVRKGWPR